MATAKSTAVLAPNLGLRFDKPPLALRPEELQDGLNFRIKDGKLNNLNLGWTRFATFELPDPVNLISSFFIRGGAEQLVFGTKKDLYRYDEGDETVYFITPVYVTGTVAVSGTAVTGTGTSWSANAKIGDYISFGSNAENDPAATWYLVSAVPGNTSITLSTSAGTIGAGAAYTLRRTFTGDADDVWAYDTFVNAAGIEDRWYASNGVDAPVRWNGITDFAVLLTSLGITKVKAIAVFQNMMVWANFEQSGTLYPTSIINSDIGDPEDISSGLSEQFVIHSETSDISCIYSLADNLVIYSPRIIVVAQFVGDPLIFTLRTATTGVGPMSPNAIADFGDYHLFLGFDSQYKFDGVTLNEENAHVWREAIRRNDPLRRNAAFAHFDEENGDLIWVMAQTSDAGAGTAGEPPERAFVLHYLEDVDPRLPSPHSQREMPFTASGFYERKAGLTWDQISDTWADLNFRWNDQFFAVAFPFSLMGDADGKVWYLNTQQDKGNGDPLDSYVHFGRKGTGDGRMRGLVRRVYPFATALPGGMRVELSLMDHAAGDATITDTQQFDTTLVEGGHFTSHFRRGRYFELLFGTHGPSEPWELGGYDVDVSGGGMR